MSSAAHAQLLAEAGAYRIRATTDPPVVPAQGKVRLFIHVTDRSGQPVSGVTVRALTKMPGMDMGERQGTAVPAGNGEAGVYTVPATFAMEGGYESTVALSGPLGDATARLTLHTGQNTATQAAKSTVPWSWLVGVSIALVVVAFVVQRMRRAGTLPDTANVINRQTVGAVVLLVVVTGVAIYAVNHLRRPGALTPVDAQAMDMSYMPPPPGFTPVELSEVTQGDVESRLRLPATVASFAEQPVYARITGTLLSMPFYAGNRVRRGQILARLDTSQTLPAQAEREAGVAQAQAGVAVARTDESQAEAAITQAHAELSGKRGAVVQAQNAVQAMREARTVAQADAQTATAQVADAQAQITVAQAEAVYAKAQFERSSVLLKAGVVSGKEYQKDRAATEQAEARVAQATAQLAQVRAAVQAKNAAVREAVAQIAASEGSLQMAQSDLDAHVAHVRVTQAAQAVTRQKTLQAQGGVMQARAMLAAATANQGYAILRSPFDGVVVARQMTPGTLVNPGQAILTVAQIDPIRVQASVAQEDLATLRVGGMVRITGQNGGRSIVSRVTSVVPAVDTEARTGIVEAIVPNSGNRLLPGQFLTMEATTARRRGVLRVPTRALVYRPVSGDVASDRTSPIVWVAEAAGAANQFTVRPVVVQIGEEGGDVTEILSGLVKGQHVVTAGSTYLKEGDTVATTETTTAPVATMMPSATEATVAVTERGFEPSSLSLKVGVSVRITFTRKTDNTCAKEVVFPDYGITKPLPLNTPVVVSFTPKKGTFTFACGMNMIKGKGVAQ